MAPAIFFQHLAGNPLYIQCFTSSISSLLVPQQEAQALLEVFIFYEPSFKARSMEMGVGKNANCRDAATEVVAEREDPSG